MSNPKFEAIIAQMHRKRNETGIDLGGKVLYSKVQDRLEVFRLEWGDEYGIDTAVTCSGFEQGDAVLANAKIVKAGQVLASGWAVEWIGSNEFTQYSPVEVAETSAIGRALACFGLHGGEYASADEIQKVQRHRDNGGQPSHQQVPPKQQQKVMTGLFVPTDHDEMWLQPDVMQNNIMAEIDGIRTVQILGQYYHECRPFIDGLMKENAPLAAELKAAFATANKKLTET